MAKVEHLARKAAKSAEGTLREEIEALGAQIARLGERSVEQGQDRVAEEVDRLKAGVEALLDRLGKQGESVVDTVTDTVRNRPITSLVGAFATGVVLSALLSRRSS